MQKILIGVDGSVGSLAAVEWAAEVATPLGASVIAAAVFDVQHLVAMSFGYALTDTSADQWQRELQRDLDGKWTKPLRESGAKLSTVVAEGHPPDVLIHLAEENHADLIVVGSRGLGSVRELFLGSVSHALTLRAPCPVVIIPHRHNATSTPGG